MNKRKERLLNVLLQVARVVFGLTLVFSGFVKAVDPTGVGYKVEDYLISFNFEFLIPLALPFAVGLILLEFILGVLILLGLYRKTTSAVALLFMAFMTPLTLYVAIANPVKDCGCFGDALVISNWNTFYKNIVLSFFAILIVVYHKRIQPLYSNRYRGIVLGVVFVLSLSFCIYNLAYLPVIDFRPYKVGVNIAEQLERNLGSGDVYKNVYIYEKDGVEKEFSEDNYPWEDSTWTFVDYRSELIKEGAQPLFDDFHILAYERDGSGAFVEGDEITEEVLSKSVALLVASTSLDNACLKEMQKVALLADYADRNDVEVFITTASGAETIEQWDEKLGNPKLTYAFMDELTLKTMIRANPGLLLLSNGEIIKKWSNNGLPSQKKLDKMFAQLKANEKIVKHNNYLVRLLIVCALFVIPLFVLKWCDNRSAN